MLSIELIALDGSKQKFPATLKQAAEWAHVSFGGKLYHYSAVLSGNGVACYVEREVVEVVVGEDGSLVEVVASMANHAHSTHSTSVPTQPAQPTPEYTGRIEHANGREIWHRSSPQDAILRVHATAVKYSRVVCYVQELALQEEDYATTYAVLTYVGAKAVEYRSLAALQLALPHLKVA